MTAHPPGSHTIANAKIAARKINISLEDYLRERAAGRRWCSRCRSWRAHVHRGWCSPCRHGRVPVEHPARPAPPQRPVLAWTDPRSPWMAEVEVEICDEGPGHRWGRAPRVTGRAGAETTGRARPKPTKP